MAATHGGAADSLRELLGEPRHESDVFQAAVLLRRLAGETCVVDPDTVFRFRGDARLAFPAVDGELLESPEEGPLTLSLAAFGLVGVLGPLPHAFSELVAHRCRLGDEALAAFLAIFEHRLARLLLEAHCTGHFWLGFSWRLPAAVPADQRGEPTGEAVETALFGLAGLAREEVRERIGLPPLALLPYAGLLAGRPRSSSAVAAILEDLFGVEARIKPFLGAWISVPRDSRSHLGHARIGEAGGDELILGDRYFDPAVGFRVALGPMSLTRLLDLLPGRYEARVMSALVLFLVGPEQPFDYELSVRPDEAPDARLSQADEVPQRLGQTLWLYSDDEGTTRCPPVSGPHLPRFATAAADMRS